MGATLQLAGLVQCKFPDGAKKGFLWKYSDSKGRMIFLPAAKGPNGEKWNKPKLFKSVQLFNGTKDGAPLLCKLKISPFSKWFFEDKQKSGRQIWVSKFTKRRQLPTTPCTMVFDGHYIVIPKPQDRND